jgi:hypothetical protein
VSHQGAKERIMFQITNQKQISKRKGWETWKSNKPNKTLTCNKKALLFIQNIRCNKRTSIIHCSYLVFALWKNPTPGSFRWRELMRNREANQNIFALVQPIFEVRWWALWVWWASPHIGG